MSVWVDQQWVDQIKIHLPRFKWKRNNVGEFRCIVCGDSDKSDRKTRGYLYEDKKHDRFHYRCHNCGYSKPFFLFLKNYFPHEYQEYRLESFKARNFISGSTSNTSDSPKAPAVHSVIPDKPLPLISYKSDPKTRLSKPKPKPKPEPTKIPQPALKRLVCLDQLEHGHMGIEYVRGRKIPTMADDRMYFTGDFEAFIRSNWPDTASEFKFLPNDDRLVFLMRKPEPPHSVFGLQGRALGDSGMRYITMRTDDSMGCKIFGLERLNKSCRHLVFEGPIDSLFFPNSVALCGGDIGNSVHYVNAEKAIYVFDNEPHSPDTVNRMHQAIKKGVHVAFFPTRKYAGMKDVNKMVLNGITREEILADIINNAYKGARALLEFNQWKGT